MGTHWPKPGLNNVGEYQASGHAYAVPSATGEIRVDLDFVASGVTVCNLHNSASVSFFDSAGLEKNVVLGYPGSHKFDTKFVRLQLTGSGGKIGAVCQITNIPAASFVTLPHASMGTIS